MAYTGWHFFLWGNMPTIDKTRYCKAFGCSNTTTGQYCSIHQQLSKRMCSMSGCNQYAIDNNNYCEVHSKQARQGDKTRNKVYSNKWHQLSRAYRLEHPLCEVCKSKGKLTSTRLTHHIKAIEDGGDVFDESNLIALCNPCHERIHNRRRPRC